MFWDVKGHFTVPYSDRTVVHFFFWISQNNFHLNYIIRSVGIHSFWSLSFEPYNLMKPFNKLISNVHWYFQLDITFMRLIYWFFSKILNLDSFTSVHDRGVYLTLHHSLYLYVRMLAITCYLQLIIMIIELIFFQYLHLISILRMQTKGSIWYQLMN